jgi:hypothetical protein
MPTPKYPPGTVFKADFEAGLGNQLLVFQKTACLALASKGFVVTPVLFHCDKTEARVYCDPAKTFPLSEMVTINARLDAIVSHKAPTQIIKLAYYQTDYCGGSNAFSFPDLVRFSPQVVAYGESLRSQCPLPCLVVQYRTGRDWEHHRETSINKKRVDAAVQRYKKAGCVLLTPESTRGLLPCARVRHAPNTSQPLRFFGELYVAATASVFAYNRHSTTYHVVRRMAGPTLKLVSLQSRAPH